jgi:hypothetical protein
LAGWLMSFHSLRASSCKQVSQQKCGSGAYCACATRTNRLCATHHCHQHRMAPWVAGWLISFHSLGASSCKRSFTAEGWVRQVYRATHRCHQQWLGGSCPSTAWGPRPASGFKAEGCQGQVRQT